MKRQRTLLALLAGACVLVGAFWFLQMRSNQNEAAPEAKETAQATNLVKKTAAARVSTNTANKPQIPGPTVKGKPGTNTIPAATAARKGPTNIISTVTAKGKTGTNALASTRAAVTNASPTLSERISQITASRGFYPAIGFILVGIILLLVALRSRQKPVTLTPALSTAGPARKHKRQPPSQCNVLAAPGEDRKLWQFSARNGAFVLTREHKPGSGQPLPRSVVDKDWRTLWQRKLNIAWLSPESVFLRVAQFPMSDFDETLAMVELQLEKLSPIPVAQVVWSIQTLPHPEESLQTIVVLIVSRTAIEEYLTRLESEGFQADRLEIRFLDELDATPQTGDGAWVYAATADAGTTGLVAWWFGGVLCNLDLVTLQAENAAAGLREQITQMTWAGELEGWLKSQPTWHLVADDAAAATWEPALREALEQPVEVVPRRPVPELASLTAARAAQDERQANLMPPEFLTRYRQRFVDRLWMRGLAAVLLLYCIGVGIYLVALKYASFRTKGVENQVLALGTAYTNAMQLKARFDVLKDRQDLKYAALDCWRAVAELLPENITLDGFSFSDGRRVNLNGNAPAGEETQRQLIAFEDGMRKAQSNNQLLFDSRKVEPITYRANPGANSLSWTLTLELKRVEVQ